MSGFNEKWRNLFKLISSQSIPVWVISSLFSTLVSLCNILWCCQYLWIFITNFLHILCILNLFFMPFTTLSKESSKPGRIREFWLSEGKFVATGFASWQMWFSAKIFLLTKWSEQDSNPHVQKKQWKTSDFHPIGMDCRQARFSVILKRLCAS